jgi:hypothetical protein
MEPDEFVQQSLQFSQLMALLGFAFGVLIFIVLPVGYFVYRQWFRYFRKDVKHIPMKDGGTLVVLTDADGTSYIAYDRDGEEIEHETVTYEAEYERLLG